VLGRDCFCSALLPPLIGDYCLLLADCCDCHAALHRLVGHRAVPDFHVVSDAEILL